MYNCELITYFNSNYLKIKYNNTQSIFIDPIHNQSIINSLESLILLDMIINLSVIFDCKLNINPFINKKICSDRFSKIRKLINFQTSKMLLSSLIFSNINNCIALMTFLLN